MSWWEFRGFWGILQRSQSVPASVAPNTKGYLKISQTFQVALSRFRLSPHAQRPPETLFQTFHSDTPQQNAARTHVQTTFSLRRFIAVFTCFKADKSAEAVNNDTEHNTAYFSHFPSKQKSTGGSRCPFLYRFPYFFTAGSTGLAGPFGAGAPTEA